MQTLILDKQRLLSAESSQQIRERVSKLTAMAGVAISSVKLRISDINGPKGGEDKCAKFEVYVEGRGVLLASARDKSLTKAIGQALARIRRSLRGQKNT